MTLGLSDRFQILQHSPHDSQPETPSAQVPREEEQEARWVPSRYNIRAIAEDGRIVIWNSYKGSMSVFGAEQRHKIESLLSQRGFSARRQGIVKYLFDRGFLIKEGTDEFRRIQLGFGEKHYRRDRLELILLASEDCNFRCTYCYEDFARGTMKPWVREGIKKLVQDRLGSLQSLSVNWFGGEPLYGFEAIEDLAAFFMKISEEHSLGYSSAMTTNGYLLSAEVAEKLLAWKVRHFQITIDGLEEDHNRSRPSRDGQSTYGVILRNLKTLACRKEDFIVDVRFNFDQQNHHQCPDFLDMIEREFNRDPRFRLRFRSVGKWGGPNDDKLDVCGTRDISNLEREMKREARKRGLTLGDEISSISGMGSQVCYAARPYNFLIGATGKLMKCTVDLDKDDRNVIGQLTEAGELLIDRDKLARWTEPAFESDGKCKKCVVLPVCQGIYCPLVRMDSGESPCTPLRTSIKKDLIEAVHGASPKRRVVV